LINQSLNPLQPAISAHPTVQSVTNLSTVAPETKLEGPPAKKSKPNA
jgi:hypothetical protein